MDEEELDALNWRPFGTKDAMRLDAQNRENTGLVMTLGVALWGKTPADLQRQLMTPHPEIPPGFGLADFQRLLQWIARVSSAVLMYQRLRGLPAGVLPQETVFVGTEGFTEWDARREIVRRVIDHLEKS